MSALKINYPRAGRTGPAKLIPSWRLTLGLAVTLLGLAVLAGGAGFAYAWFATDIPEENDVASAQTSIVYWNDGQTELVRLGDTNRIPVSLADVPQRTQQAVLAAEDRTFYQHNGFAVGGLARAAWANLTRGTAQGGSTVTQQYTKNAYLSADKTYTRKVRELVISLKLETQLTKEEILERYLNTIYFGRGAYGIQTAAEAYFGVPASELTLEQGVALAAIINAPGRYSPDRDLPRLEQRYSYVLDGMVAQGWISAKRAKRAERDFPEFVARQSEQRFAGPNGHLIAAAKKEAIARGFTEDELEAGGLRITTTFDPRAQQAAIDAVSQAGPNIGTKGLRVGLAAVRPGTGEVVALYGGADYLANSLNNATQAIAQAGSTFKPFALAAAVESGISLYSRWPGNSPHTVASYTFQNYANNSYGPSVSLLSSTENSINSAFVELEHQVGVDAVRDMALRAGIPASITGWEETNDLTFVLGTASPHTLDVASAYATFAARGVRTEPTVLAEITDSQGDTLYEAQDTSEQTIDPRTADTVNYALQSVVRNGTGRPALGLGRPAAGKTGSTDEYLSAWFAGYTPQLSTAVSFSKDDAKGNPVSLSGTGGMPAFYGSGYPARVWTAFMRGALANEPVEQFVSPWNGPGYQEVAGQPATGSAGISEPDGGASPGDATAGDGTSGDGSSAQDSNAAAGGADEGAGASTGSADQGAGASTGRSENARPSRPRPDSADGSGSPGGQAPTRTP